MNERQATAILRSSLEDVDGAWFYKIPDDARPSDDGVRRIVERPCDIIGAYQGKSIGIEAKLIARLPPNMGDRAFHYEMLTKSQKKHLPRMHRAGAEVFIAAVVADGNRLYVIPWAEFWQKRIYTRMDIEYMHFFQGCGARYPVHSWLELGMPDMRAFCPCGLPIMHHEDAKLCNTYRNLGIIK